MKRIGYLLVGVFLLTGCRDIDDYRTERAEYAIKHFSQAKMSEVDRGKHYTLVECIAIALEHNLDQKILKMEEVLAREGRTAEMLGMLPELSLSNNFTKRDSASASRSQRLDGGDGGGTHSYSMSSEEGVYSPNIDLMFSVIDFGLSFFNSMQARDRELARQLRTKRAGENLALEVVRAYFRVAATQRSITITKNLLEQCRDRYELIKDLEKSKAISPFRAYDEIKRFVDMEKRLNAYIRTYENSCIDLRVMLGFYPNSEILVDDTMLDRIPEFSFPSVEQMEQIAMLERAELYEADITKHLLSLERKKALLQMFPNVRLFVDFSATTNSYLYYQSWWEVGVRSTYSLLRLPQQLARRKAMSTEIDIKEMQGYIQAIAIMAQVRISHANIGESRDRFEISKRMYDAYRDNLAAALKASEITGELSRLELDHLRLATAESEIEYLINVSNIYTSYYRMLNSVGVSELGAGEISTLQRELDAAALRVQEKEKLVAAKAAQRAVSGASGDCYIIDESKNCGLSHTAWQANEWSTLEHVRMAQTPQPEVIYEVVEAREIIEVVEVAEKTASEKVPTIAYQDYLDKNSNDVDEFGYEFDDDFDKTENTEIVAK